MKLDQIERYFQYVQIPENPFTECWEWMGWKDSKGYGRFRLGGRNSRCVAAHRFMLEYWLGRPMAKRLEGDHTCENRGCVSPLHVIEVTPRKQQVPTLRKASFPEV